MKRSTLIAASTAIALTTIATSARPAHAQYGYGYVVPYYPEQTSQTIYYPQPQLWYYPRGYYDGRSHGTGRVFDAMQNGIRYFFDY